MLFGSKIPADVRRLIDEHIGSAAQLEVLLLLWERRQMDWSADEVSRELRSTPDIAGRSLAELTGARLLTCSTSGETLPAPGKDAPGEARYRFPAEDESLARTLAALEKAYRERRYSIIDLIYARPTPGSVTGQADSARAFSDAFRIRRDEDS